MAPQTPEQWLLVLAQRLDRRRPRIKKLRRYANGDPDLPEMQRNLRASWERFQRKARIDLGGLACSAFKARIRPNGLIVGADQDAPLAQQARRIYRDNRLETQFDDAIIDRIQTSVGYLVVGRDTDGTALVSRERPEDFYAEPDPVRPWRAQAAIKAWRNSLEERDYVWVWADGQRQKFMRPSKVDSVTRENVTSNDWEKVGEPESYAGSPPVVILSHTSGMALIEPHIDLIDSINLGKLQRLVITAMQAYRQRAIKGDLPEKDDDGNDIDWGAVFEPAPGALWDLPADVDIWESETFDFRPLLDAEKADKRDFAAVTNTPISVFVPDAANQSAEGAANAKEGHIAKATDEIKALKPALAMVIVHALRIEGADLGDVTVEVDFAPPWLTSQAERYAAAAQAKAAGLSRRTILRTIVGMSPDEIAKDEADFAEEQLAAATLAAVASGTAGES